MGQPSGYDFNIINNNFTNKAVAFSLFALESNEEWEGLLMYAKSEQ